mmetsp:Transcript_36854/g.65989  ORF Transcript_36854/g.65989 Transcript_36854/m.65989 type:complete len:216 (+) Transcript_36854:373-1020(+)
MQYSMLSSFRSACGNIVSLTLLFLSPSWGTSSMLPNHSPLSRIFQDSMPGLRFSSGKAPVISTRRSDPLERRNTSATTASFSTGLKVQVEYTMRPPILSSRAACRVIRTCNGCRATPLLVFHLRQMSGALRSVPSPQQGTSHKMRSNRRDFSSGSALSRGTCGKYCPSWLVTSRQGEQMRLVWCVSRLQRCMSASLATTRPGGVASEPACSISRI